ncbi:uncharacterized protein LOC111003899 [Pieris rapae]|uniref:uncharacterized protein LOC111003899 n=1 Tax=Pieris rapae TaxID=64459 RepID=UPI000B9288F5|nr:uncharacterized protein LOC111003899 [Pieris rapae]
MERSVLKIRKIPKIKSEKIRRKTKVIDALHYALKQKWLWSRHIVRYTDERWTINCIERIKGKKKRAPQEKVDRRNRSGNRKQRIEKESHGLRQLEKAGGGLYPPPRPL